ncbi:NPXTG-anchored protein [Ruminococcus sp.]
MKISKILAGMSAAALAASMMSLAAFADETATVKADLTGGTVSLIDEKDDDGVVTKTGVLTGTNVKLSDVCGIDVNVTVGADSAAKIEAGDWIGGGLGYNSESTGWASKEWSFQEGAKDVTGVKAADGSYDFVLKGTDPVFADTDTYAQVWLQNWSTKDFTFNAFTLLDKDGNPILVVESDKAQGGNTVDLSEYKKQTEVTLNGEGLATSDGGKVRINIKHPWADDAHKAAFNLADDWSALAGADAIAVTVDISNVTDEFNAYPCFSAGIEGGIGYWEASDNNPAVTVNADGTYTFIVKFPSALEMDAKNMFFDINTDLAGTDGEDPAVKMAVKSVVALNKSDEKPTDSTEPTDSTDSTDSDESKANPTDSVDSKTNSAATSSKAANNASNTNPSTGAAALAAVGVALAGAAVVATKKRK